MALQENIDTREGSAAAKFLRRSMLAQVAYQVNSASERIKLGLARTRAGGKRVGRPPALRQEQAEQCRRMADESASLRQIARVFECAPITVSKVVIGGGKWTTRAEQPGRPECALGPESGADVCLPFDRPSTCHS